MPNKDNANNAAYIARSRAKADAAGLVRVEVVVPADRKDDIKAAAERMRKKDQTQIDRVPNKWIAADGIKRTIIGELPDNGESIVISKSFFSSKRRWQYFAEPKWLVLWLISQQDTR
jgi:hypothetical protein